MAVDTAVMLMEYLTQDVVAEMVSELGLDMKTALYTFYTSRTGKAVLDVKTGLYRESPAYILELLQREREV